MIVEALAVGCSGLFAGAAVYVNLVEHPARLECGNNVALREFAPSYRRATVMQASLAVGGAVSGLVAWLFGSGMPFLLGAVLLGSVVPFTLIVIFPTNHRLLDPALLPDSGEATDLLASWGRLHAVRSLLSISAFAIELVGAFSRAGR